MSWLYNALFFLQTEAGEVAQKGTEAASQSGGEAAPKGACGAMGGGPEFLIWMVFLFGLMYFLLIRPQKKQQQKHQEMITSLKKGTES